MSGLDKMKARILGKRRMPERQRLKNVQNGKRQNMKNGRKLL